MQDKIEGKRLAIFLVTTVMFLVPISILYSTKRDSSFLTLLMFTPMISMGLTRIITKEGFHSLSLKPKFKVNWKRYLFVYLGTPFIAYFGAVVFFILFPENFDPLASKYALDLGVSSNGAYFQQLLLLIPLAILINPIAGLVQCFGEEIAWRGYLLQKLNHFMPRKKAVILSSAIWGLWHGPIVYQGFNYGQTFPLLNVFAMTIFCIMIGTICSYLFFSSETIWMPVVFHAALNSIDQFAPADLLTTGKINYFIGPNLVGIIGGLGFMIMAFICWFKIRNEEKQGQSIEEVAPTIR